MPDATLSVEERPIGSCVLRRSVDVGALLGRIGALPMSLELVSTDACEQRRNSRGGATPPASHQPDVALLDPVRSTSVLSLMAVEKSPAA